MCSLLLHRTGVPFVVTPSFVPCICGNYHACTHRSSDCNGYHLGFGNDPAYARTHVHTDASTNSDANTDSHASANTYTDAYKGG